MDGNTHASQGSEAITKQKQEAGVADKPDSVPAQPIAAKTKQ